MEIFDGLGEAFRNSDTITDAVQMILKGRNVEKLFYFHKLT